MSMRIAPIGGGFRVQRKQVNKNQSTPVTTNNSSPSFKGLGWVAWEEIYEHIPNRDLAKKVVSGLEEGLSSLKIHTTSFMNCRIGAKSDLYYYADPVPMIEICPFYDDPKTIMYYAEAHSSFMDLIPKDLHSKIRNKDEKIMASLKQKYYLLGTKVVNTPVLTLTVPKFNTAKKLEKRVAAMTEEKIFREKVRLAYPDHFYTPLAFIDPNPAV